MTLDERRPIGGLETGGCCPRCGEGSLAGVGDLAVAALAREQRIQLCAGFALPAPDLAKDASIGIGGELPKCTRYNRSSSKANQIAKVGAEHAPHQ
jgi:hypothetical protein